MLEVVKTGQNVPLRSIKTSRQKVRRTTSEGGIQELLNSLLKQGQIHAISLLQESDGSYELINGHRRFTAALHGKLPLLRANVYRVPEGREGDRELLIQQHLHAANMAEPLLNLERGMMFEAVKNTLGLDDVELAACFEGETVESIRSAMSFLAIDKATLDVIQANPERFNEGIVRVLAEYASADKRSWRLKPEEQMRVAEMVVKQENKLAAADPRELEKEVRKVVKTRRAESRPEPPRTAEVPRTTGDSTKALIRRVEQLERAVTDFTSHGVAGVAEIHAEDKRQLSRRLYAIASQIDDFIQSRFSQLPVSEVESQ